MREYDLFERFPDGSSLFRASILGLAGTHDHLREMGQKSCNQFYAIDITTGKVIMAVLGRKSGASFAPRSVGVRTKSVTA